MIGSGRKARLKQFIVDAFADVSYPGDNAIALHPTDEDGAQINQAFTGHHWRDLPHDAVDKHQAMFLRSDAKRFYMPAYLLRTLDTERTAASCVVYDLDPPDKMDRFQYEYDFYTPAQRNAIRLFLEWMRDESVDHSSRVIAQGALDRYWGREDGAASRESTISAELSGKDRLKQAIRDAFADVPYPGDKAIGYEPWDDEAAELNRDFATYHWREVPRSVLAYHCWRTSLFSDQGKQFYMPAFLLAALDDFASTLDSCVYQFAPNIDVEWPYRDYDLYTPTQRDVIRRFLEYVRDEVSNRHLRQFARIGLDMIWTRQTSWPAEGSPESTSDPVRKEQVKQAIFDAFADVPYPGDDAILDEDGKALSSYSKEAELIRDFKGVNARAVPRKVLVHHNSAFGNFSTQALQYYLPAYLTAALENVGDLVYWVVYLLDPTDQGKAVFHHNFNGYTPSQKSAIARFLEYVRDAMPHVTIGDLAQHALDQYWSKGAP